MLHASERFSTSAGSRRWRTSGLWRFCWEGTRRRPMSILDFTSRRHTFRRLHESGCFVIPNPWDAGSARYLQHLGFQALATTSAGFAFSCGLPDAARVVSRDGELGNIAEIVAAVDLPVNADF